MEIESVNPATGEVLKSYEAMSLPQAKGIVEAAHRSQVEWRQRDFAERSRRMRVVAALLREQAEPLARLMAEEMGKPLAQGVAEAQKCAWVCEYFAEQARSFLADEPVATESRRSFVAFEPLGVIFAIMPWNFPFWQVFRCAAPGLMAGNACVLKHASNVTGCALKIESLFREAGFPESLFRVVLLPGSRALELIDHPLVAAVTFTGSGPSGRAVAERAGRNLKKTVLELGGSDAYLVLEDADLEQAVRACVESRLINSGQSCIAAKRFIVVQGDAGLPDPVLGPDEPLAHGRRRHQEGRGDPFRVQAKHYLQHQRRANADLDGRMGAGEHQGQTLVRDFLFFGRGVQPF
jgi:succinate-semialdehyde dehydrogenase/glutarate-semialdehyde dehydrogenase